MAWTWRKENLDLILVPIGISIMLIYHLSLLFRFLRYPKTTLLGFENHCKREWVEKMMQLDAKDRSLAVSVLNSNISAATSLSSISLVLSSLLGAWIGGSRENIYTSTLIYGDIRPATISIKYITLLAFFLAAFACFVQTTRCYVHANFLVSMPNCVMPEEFVKKAVIAGSNYWSLGMRALYFATTLLMWIFGPIPMFVSAVIMVAALHHMDTSRIPLRPFEGHRDRNELVKIGQELSDVNRAIERHVRPNMDQHHLKN